MISFLKKYSYELVLGFLIFTYIILFSWMTIHRYLSFGSYYYDLGIMNQVVHSTAHGHFLEMTNQDFGKNMSRFAIHFDPIIAMFAPFYWISDGPEVLLIGQTIILGVGALAVYLLAKHVLENKSYSLMFALSYLLYYALHWQNMFDFHGVALATTFLLFGIYFTEIKKYKWSYLFIILSLLTKEHVGLVVAMYGLYLLIFRKQRKYGLALFITAVAFFSTSVFYIIPHARQVDSYYLRYYKDLGDGPGGVLIGLLKNPLQVFAYILNISRSGYILKLLSSYGIFVLFSPIEFLIGTPEMLINLLSSNPNLRSIFHYNALTLPFILYSAIAGFRNLKKFGSARPWVIYVAVVCFALLTLRSVYLYSVLPVPLVKNPYYKIRPLNSKKLDRVRAWQKNLKDSNIPVASTPQIAPFFTSRRYYYNFLFDTEFAKHGLDEADIINTRSKYENADYVIIADSELSDDQYLLKAFSDHLKSNKKYKLVDDMDGIKAYKKITN